MEKYIFNYKQYQKNINKKCNYNFSIYIFIIILLLGICLFFKPKNQKTEQYHIVYADAFQTYKEAINLSTEISKKNGAGFIYFDDKYFVLLSLYINLKDAEKVCYNLKNTYQNINILTIEKTKFKISKKINNSQNQSVKNLLEISYKHIFKLSQLSNDFDSKKISFYETSITLKDLTKEFAETYENFLSQFKNNPKYNIAKDYVQHIYSSYKNLSNSNDNNISQILRYETISITINRLQFQSCF